MNSISTKWLQKQIRKITKARRSELWQLIRDFGLALAVGEVEFKPSKLGLAAEYEHSTLNRANRCDDQFC